MIFLGVDFGWVRNASGLAALVPERNGLHLQCLTTRIEIEDVLSWIDDQAGTGAAVVAVDAPLVIGNATGMREADKMAHRLYGRFHAGCYPANRASRFANRTTGFSAALRERGFMHPAAGGKRAVVRQQMEVFPHIGAVELFGLDRIVKYKKGTLADRARGLHQFHALLLARLPALNPPVHRLDLPAIAATGKALKQVEDQLDALLCAYLAAYWWWWGRDRNRILGDETEGYIVIPKVCAL